MRHHVQASTSLLQSGCSKEYSHPNYNLRSQSIHGFGKLLPLIHTRHYTNNGTFLRHYLWEGFGAPLSIHDLHYLALHCFSLISVHADVSLHFMSVSEVIVFHPLDILVWRSGVISWSSVLSPLPSLQFLLSQKV